MIEMRKLIDVISLSLVAVVVGGIAVLNIAQTERPTISEMENRTLAEMPEFSVDSLFDGSYFKGLSAFVSDTFPERDRLVALSKKMDTWKGIEYKIGGDGSFVVLSPTGNVEETVDPDIGNLLDQAFENLKNPETGAPNDSSDPKETLPIVSGEIEFGDPETTPKETGPSETTPPETKPRETESPEIIPPETDPSWSGPVETDPVETEPPETEPQYYVNSLTLSKESVSLTVGSGTTIYARLDTNNPNPGNVKWSITDQTVISISISADGGLNIKGLAAGTCDIKCRYGDLFTVTCQVTVTEITSVPPNQTELSADFLTNGMFIYGDAVHTPAWYNKSAAELYMKTAAYYKTLFGSSVRMNVVVGPVSSMVVDNPKVLESISDQKTDILDKMEALADGVNFVDAYSTMYEHRSEYLYFKSDHHWTQLGAYYAYVAYAKSVGLTPSPLSAFNHTVISDAYKGSMYMYTQDERVKAFVDRIDAYTSKKPHTMTVTGADGTTYTLDSTVAQNSHTYAAFISGDNPYTVINVPENPQNFNILVLKDSFGNAFVPFLCEHYGNIIVVDTRYASFNIYEALKDYGLSDIVFVNNIQAANSAAWSNMYLAAVGVSQE